MRSDRPAVTIDRRTLIGGAAGLAALSAAPAKAQKDDRQMREDWPWLGRYAAENAVLLASGAATGIVFMGDSITEGWRDKRPGFFTVGRVCRGVGGQTTPQMVLRMMADVVALKPRAVHIMAGTNDIAGNTGPMPAGRSQDNLAAMAMLAKAHGIRVLLASVPPADGFPWRPGLATVAPIRALNVWAKAYAATIGATWIDYTPAIGAASGAMKPGLAYDGVHPNEAGYDAMIAVIAPVLKDLNL